MKPFIESVLNTPSYDWIVKEFYGEITTDEFSCSWHYHAEYELVLYESADRGFTGNYFAGDAIEAIEEQTMLLYGPGLPHMITGRFSNAERRSHRSVIVWFTHEWVEKVQALIPEARNIRRLLDNASYGVKFSETVTRQVLTLLRGIEQLERPHQAIKIMEMLLLLSGDKETTRVSSRSYRIKPVSDDDATHQKINKATRYIEENYGRNIKVEDLCQALHISESSAYRLFDKHYGMSFSEHLKQYRIGKACELLASNNIPISLVAEQAGFSNLSNFNRLFKGAKSMTPSQFRRHYS